MSQAFVSAANANNYGGGTSATLVVSLAPTTTGNDLIVYVDFYAPGGETVSAVNDTAINSYTLVASHNGPGPQRQEIWLANNITGVPVNSIVVTPSAPVAYWGVTVGQYSGNAAAPFDTSASGDGSAGSVTSGAFTTAQADELLIACAVVNNVGTVWTAGSGFTKRWDDGTNAFSDQVVSSIQIGATVTMTNSAGNPNSILVTTFKAASVVSGEPTIYYAQQRQQ